MSTRACNHLSAMAKPGEGEGGQTGDWRTMRPVIDESRCICAQTGEWACPFCWMFCPELVVERTVPIEIDLTYCKGCGICARECPRGAITMEPEAEAGHE